MEGSNRSSIAKDWEGDDVTGGRLRRTRKEWLLLDYRTEGSGGPLFLPRIRIASVSLTMIVEGRSLKSFVEPRSLQRKSHPRKVSFFTIICQPTNLYHGIPSPKATPTVSPYKPSRRVDGKKEAKRKMRWREEVFKRHALGKSKQFRHSCWRFYGVRCPQNGF